MFVSSSYTEENVFFEMGNLLQTPPFFSGSFWMGGDSTVIFYVLWRGSVPFYYYFILYLLRFPHALYISFLIFFVCACVCVFVLCSEVLFS